MPEGTTSWTSTNSLTNDQPFACLGRRRMAFAAIFAAAACSAVHAQPSVPWMPSAAARHAIELLVDEAGLDLPTTQWPLPHSAVVRALDALPSSLPNSLVAARDRVRRELIQQGESRLSFTVRNRADALSGFGDDSTPGSSVALRSSVLASSRIALQVAGRIETRGDADHPGSQFRLEDSALVTEALGLQLQVWSHRSWWSPGWQSALALSNNAPAFTGVGIQRASASRSESRWLSWMGPWNIEMFVAQDEDVADPENPFLFGGRLTMRPFSNVEIGITKMAQWGGDGRHAGVNTFMHMLTGAHSNADTDSQRLIDPANGLAGFDWRVRCPTGLRCAAYGQLIGEDEAGYMPSKYLGMYGMEVWSADGANRFFAEYAETGCRSPIGRQPLKGCAYRNYAYPQGYASAGRWIGASAGPDSRLLTVGWLDAAGASLRLNAGTVGSRIGTYSNFTDDVKHSGRLVGLSGRYAFQWGDALVSPEFDWLRVRSPSGARTEARAGMSLRMSLDGPVERVGSAWANSTPTTQAVVGLGLIAGAALLDRPLDDYAQHRLNNPSVKTIRRVGDALPVIGLGAAGLSWITQRGNARGELAFTAVEAGLGALAINELVKVAVDRSRPSDNLGPHSFGRTERSHSSFPSSHAALAWAVVTPYADHYDLPWLYGAAALTNVARVMGRDHWASDTVAGALLGHWVGHHLYRGSDLAQGAPRLSFGPRSVVLAVPFE